MTDEQRKQIKSAARALEAALNDAGGRFDVSVDVVSKATIERDGKDYIYRVNVKAVNEEAIA